MHSKLILVLVILLLISIPSSKTSLFASIIRENLSRYFRRPQSQFGFRWAPNQSSRYLLALPLSDSFKANNNLQYITRKPIINWKPLSSKHLIEESSKPMPNLIVGHKINENQLKAETKNTPKRDISYGKLVQSLHKKVPLIRPLTHLKSNNFSQNQEINYKSIVTDLQTNILSNISVIIDKNNTKENNKTQIDYKNIINDLQEKEMNTIYNQEKVFDPKYEFGFKPLETGSLQRQIKSYLQFLDDNTRISNHFHNRNDEKELFNKSHNHNSEYLPTKLSEFNQNNILTTEPFDGKEPEISTNLSSDENEKQFIKYKVDFKDKIASQSVTNADIMRKKNNEFKAYNRIKESNSFDFLLKHSDLAQFKFSGLECAQDFGWCDFNHDYPQDYINRIVANCNKQLSMMYIEIPDNLSDFDDYTHYSAINIENKKWKLKKSLCEADRKFIRPSVGQDINGNYYVIVQTSFYYQTIPIEICRSPGSLCTGVESCGINVRCTQKYRTHLLISVNSDDTQECPQMRLYRMPTACVCETSLHN